MSITIKQSADAPSIRSYTSADSSLALSLITHNVQDAPVTDSVVELKDAIFDRTTSAAYHKEGRVIVTGALAPVFTNLTPNVCDLSSEGELTRLASGQAHILVTEGGVTKKISLDMSNAGTAPVDVFTSVVSGTLMQHCTDQIDNRLVGMVKATNIPLYTSQNHSTDTFVRNPNFWASRSDGFTPVDLTSISPSNSRGNATRAGTLITPRHVLNSAHYPLYNGDKIYFVTNDNVTVERTIVGSVTHPSYSLAYPDLRLYTLDSDVPGTVTPCKTLPPDYVNYLCYTQYGKPPTLGLDQEEKGLVTDLYNLSDSVSHSIPTEAQRLAFYESKISGDSGNPSFLIINNELALLTCWTFGGAGSGTSVPYYRADINTMIQTADAQAGISPTGYTLDTVDLSSFPVLV